MALSTSWKDCSLLCIVFLLSYVRTGKMTDACLKEKLCQLSQCLSFAVEVDTEFTMFSSEAQGGPCCECEGTLDSGCIVGQNRWLGSLAERKVCVYIVLVRAHNADVQLSKGSSVFGHFT